MCEDDTKQLHNCAVSSCFSISVISLWRKVYKYNQRDIYLFKVKNTNTRKRCEILSKLTIKIPELSFRLACICLLS